MPRLFDSPRLSYTYAILMSLWMSTVVSFALGFLRLGLSWQTLHTCLVTWPFAFGLNLVAALPMSPLFRRLTLRLWGVNSSKDH